MIFKSKQIKSLALACLSLFTADSVIAEGKVELRFVSFPQSTPPLELELKVGEKDTIGIETPTNRLSKIHKVDSSDQWIIGKSDHAAGQFSFTSLGTTKAHASLQQLILIQHAETDEEKIHLIAIDSSLSGFCGGHHLLVNYTEDEIYGTFGGQEFSLDHGGYAVLEPQTEATRGSKTMPQSSPISISVRKDHDDEASGSDRPFLQSQWRTNDKARSIVLFYKDPKSGKIRLHSIRDYL